MQQEHVHLRRLITWYGPWHVGFFFCGNDIISDVNLKYTNLQVHKFAIMCVNVEANFGLLVGFPF